jgi:rhamnosyltransferase
MKVLCVIPVYNAAGDLHRLLASLVSQTIGVDILIIDSGSSDGSVDVAKSSHAHVLEIDNALFNHGGTRQLAVEMFPNFDVYLYMTQDAYLSDDRAVEMILKPFANERVGAVCGRQLPHLNATPFARHARSFNYPESVLNKTMSDVPKMGLKTAFMSNSFAAYRRDALNFVGGFPGHVIFAEDMYVAARMLINDLIIVYAGNAQCHHSHNYGFKDEFSRYFDMGVFHVREPWIREVFGGAGGEGARYMKSEFAFLGLRFWYLWPEALFRNFIKLLGYKLGQQESYLPSTLKRKLGMYKRYWDGEFASSSNR